MAAEDAPWLVKSSGRVLGPFSTVKVGELLTSREVSVLDEVSSSQKRWQTIQYHDQFRDIVESLRRSNLSEKTEATWTPTGSLSNLTQTVTDFNAGELTDEIPAGAFTMTGKEIVIHDLHEQPSPQAPNNVSSGRYQLQHTQNTAIQHKVEKTTRGLWLVTVLVLVIVVAVIFQKRIEHGENKTSLSTLKQNVVTHIQTGQYAEALHELKAFYPDPMQSGEMAIYYGSLAIQVEGQTVVGRRVLESVINSHRAEAKQAYTGLAVADLMDGQLDSAKENLKKALTIDPSFTAAIVNLATAYLQKGDYAEAKNLSFQALHQNPGQGEAMMILAEASLDSYKTTGNIGELTPAMRAMKEFLAKQWDYADEIGFFNLYFEFLKNDRTLDEKIHSYLDIDPKLTDDHRHNVFIYRGNVHWKFLAQLCNQMGEKLGDNSRAAMLLSACASHEGRWDKAKKYIERATQQAPKDALAQAWLSYILREGGEPEQSSVVLARANEFNHAALFTLPTLLQARFCASSGDVDCARGLFQKIYEHDLENLPAISGLAWVNAARNFHGEALKLLDKGLKISPDYMPLLQLRAKADKEGWYVQN